MACCLISVAAVGAVAGGSLLDLSNVARAAIATSDRATAVQAVSAIEAKLRLPRSQIEHELHGRKAVDALLNLALAGCHVPWVYSELCEHATLEVRRWGRRRSCSSMTIAQLAERTAAAGCVGPLGLYDALGGVLEERGESTYADIATALASGTFSLATSDPAARWVYRASSRHAKEASASADGFTARTDWEADGVDVLKAFEDTSRPLTVDLGCGFGCGPLVQARAHGAFSGEEGNVLGCDLSAAGISYARGIASRWGTSGRCQFVRDDARAVLHAARTRYPGGVHRVILSCPTPYATLAVRGESARAEQGAAASGDDGGTLESGNSSGNSQLPSSADDPSFLGHAEIFGEIAASLAPEGVVYLASNVEDVALTLLRNAEAHGLQAITSPLPALARATDVGAGGRHGMARAPEATPRRQQRWRAGGGERAEGAAWEAARHLPLWASETERTHHIEGRPMWRVLLRKRGGEYM